MADFDAFISYSSHDKHWADAACHVLEKRGLRCWIAPRNIVPGTEWGAAIIDGMDRSRSMVLIFSEKANSSSQVRREVERAIGKELPVVPLRIEDTRPHGAMEYALSNTHWLDAFTPPAEDRLEALADAVEGLLGLRSVDSLSGSMPTTNTLQPKISSPTSKTDSPNQTRKRGWVKLVAVSGVALLLAAATLVGLNLNRWQTASGEGDAFGMLDEEFESKEDFETLERELQEERQAERQAGVIDETSQFNGNWISIAQSLPWKGPLSFRDIKSRQYSLGITDHRFTHRRRPKENEVIGLRGIVHFEVVDGQRFFTVRAASSKRERTVWLGTYEYRDGALHLCYRESQGKIEPIRPSELYTRGEYFTMYVKLVRGTAK